MRKVVEVFTFFRSLIQAKKNVNNNNNNKMNGIYSKVNALS